jgi:phosphoglycolate phosphatase-like HAD superfamily hydrolase
MDVDFIGVLYGYGTREEMAEQGAVTFAETVEELEGLLLEKGEDFGK